MRASRFPIPVPAGLISVKACECLRQAEVVVYDRLADERLRDPEAVPLRTHTIFHRGVAIVDPVVAVETQVTILHVRRELMKRAGKHLERKRVIAVMREDIGSVLVGHEAALPSGKADIVVVYALDHDLKDLIQVDRILLKWGIEIAACAAFLFLAFLDSHGGLLSVAPLPRHF